MSYKLSKTTNNIHFSFPRDKAFTDWRPPRISVEDMTIYLLFVLKEWQINILFSIFISFKTCCLHHRRVKIIKISLFVLIIVLIIFSLVLIFVIFKWKETAITITIITLLTSTSTQPHRPFLLTTGKILVLSGTGDVQLNNTELYDPVTATWTMSDTMNNI